MKRSLLFAESRQTALVVAGTCLIAATYGLVRLAYGLFLPDIRETLDLGSAAAGYVSSGASVAYCLGALCGLVAGGRPRLLVAGALVTSSVGAAAMALAPDAVTFVPAAIVSSAGAGLASPGLVAVVQRNLPHGRIDGAQAVVNSGTGPGLVAAGAMALVLLPQWRIGFAVSAVLTAAAGAAVLLLDRPSEPSEPAADDPGPGLPSWGWLTVLRTPAVAAALLGAASAVVWTYGRTQVVAEGAGATASTVAWMALGVGGTAAALTARAMSALRPQRAWLLTCATVAASIAALGLGAGRLPLALAACLVFGWAFIAASSALIAWTTMLAPERAAAGTAALFIALTLGQAVGSSAAGVVAEGHGLSAAFVTAAAVALLAAACGVSRRAVPARTPPGRRAAGRR